VRRWRRFRVRVERAEAKPDLFGFGFSSLDERRPAAGAEAAKLTWRGLKLGYESFAFDETKVASGYRRVRGEGSARSFATLAAVAVDAGSEYPADLVADATAETTSLEHDYLLVRAA
jgi:hypothetical protein